MKNPLEAVRTAFTRRESTAEGLSPATVQIQAVATRLGCTEGQVYSMVIALTFATLLVAFGVVPLGNPLPAASAAPSIPPAVQPPVVIPNVPTPVVPVDPPILIPPVQLPGTDTPPLPDPTGTPNPGDSDGTDPVLEFKVVDPGFPAAIATTAKLLYVGTDNATDSASTVTTYQRDGSDADTVSIQGQPAKRSGGLSAAAVRGESVLLTDRSRSALLELKDGATQVLATLPNLPPCLLGANKNCEPGLTNDAPSPEGLAVTSSAAYIADAKQGTIWRYTFVSKKLESWYTNADLISGNGPSGLAVDGEGNLLFTVGQAADLGALLQGGLYKLPIGSGGAPGKRTLVSTFRAGASPGPLVVGRSGNVYVGLRGSGGIVVVGSDGKPQPVPGATAAEFPAPAGLSLADGLLYVADRGKPASATSGTVHAVSVDDGP